MIEGITTLRLLLVLGLAGVWKPASVRHVLDRELAPGAYKNPMVSKAQSKDSLLFAFFSILPQKTQPF